MMTFFLKRMALFTALAVGLLWGAAARGVESGAQTESVVYTLALEGRPNDTATWDVVTDASTAVRVVVKVAIPRTEMAGETATYRVPLSAKPVRLMMRKHKGPETAFDGSLGLTKVSDGSADVFYPMPQTGVLSTTGVPRGSAVPTYVVAGVPHDLARWEAVYATVAYSIDWTSAGGPTTHPLINSLLQNEATYEWYVASQYGVVATRISDIQDHGRKMFFREKRMWMPISEHEPILGGRLGNDFAWKLRSMPLDGGEGLGWTILRGTIDSSDEGEAGVLLLNGASTDSVVINPGTADEETLYLGAPRIESPFYPDGISKIRFWAKTSSSAADENAAPQQLAVEVSTGSTWVEVELKEPLNLTTTLKAFTVDFAEALNAEAELAVIREATRFRIVRKTTFNDVLGDDASLLSVLVRDVLVSSALPTMTVRAPDVKMSGVADTYPYATTAHAVTVDFPIEAGTTAEEPRGYEGVLNIRRKMKDGGVTWQQTERLGLPKGATTFSFSFTPGTLVNVGGVPNVEDDAFFVDDAGCVTGLLPGVYDLSLAYQAMGSFLAGRELIEQRESVSGSSDYSVTIANGEELRKPHTLDLREQATAHRELYLEVQYRSGMGDAVAPYTAETLTIPLLPSPKEPQKWRVDVSRVLRLKADDSEVYAWCYDPQSGNARDLLYDINKLSFFLYSTDLEGGNVTKFGMDSALAANVMPTPYTIVPAITETLRKDSDARMVIDLTTVGTSHVMLEVDMSQPDAPKVRMGGSYWQDFNTWYSPSSNFTTTEFREDVNSVMADFDCREFNGVTITEGWIPDEGPLAMTTSIVDTFEVGLDKASQDGFALWMPSTGSALTAWGAGHLAASPLNLSAQKSGLNYFTEYMQLGPGAELVLSRTPTLSAAGNYLPDAMIRLGGTSMITPRTDLTTITLNGVGTVNFKLGLSIPYNLNNIARLEGRAPLEIDDLCGYGLSVKVDMTADKCSKSGYSVSLYLVDRANSNIKYEFRVTEVIKFNDNRRLKPESYCYYEIYKWTGTSAAVLRLSDNTTFAFAPGGLKGTTLYFWLDDTGALHGATGTGTTPMRCTTMASVASKTSPYFLALGSAECRPTLRGLQRMPALSTTFSGAQGISSTTVALSAMEGLWTLSQDEQTSTTVKLVRNTPNPELFGKVSVIAGDRDPVPFSTTSERACSVTMGAANATLTFMPFLPEDQATSDCTVFIDDISVTSWCGNDENRNGDDCVPTFTNEGFAGSSTFGFSGVGLWVRPVSDAELTTNPATYTGEQCALLQYSRRNMTMGGNLETDGILHTNYSLALYGPYSDYGFGTVNFRYMVPSGSEDVYLMVQYSDNIAATNNHLDLTRRDNWINVSDPILLEDTEGQWLTASVTPRKLLSSGVYAELVGEDNAGTLRLVMVMKAPSIGYVPDVNANPVVYIDDFTVTDNAEGVLASWQAENVKLTETPASLLYWKDRVAVTEPGYAEETFFADKRGLTTAMQLNNIGSGQGVETVGGVDYAMSCLTSPILTDGVGRVTFAARLAETGPTRLYLYVRNENDTVNSDWQALTYVDINSSVYTSFDIDLSKFTKYKMKLNADGTPDTETGTGTFLCQEVTHLQFRTVVEGTPLDDFGDTPSVGRVLLDQIAIANPVMPSIRVKEVAFSNAAKRPTTFERNSPLSQPVANASALHAMVKLDREQLLKQDSIRVFLTFNPDNTAVKTYGADPTDDPYSYTDVLGETVEADMETPVYAWATPNTWGLSTWFDLTKLNTTFNDDAVDAKTYDPKALGGVYANTVELTRDGTTLNYYCENLQELVLDHAVSSLTAFQPNQLIRYTAWVVYQSSETDQWFISTIDVNDYTEFPWYFPRSLNKEIHAKAQAAEDAAATAEGRASKTLETGTYFCPYYWVYSCSPGEVFLNEINLDDASSPTPNPGSFVEFCAPTSVELQGWRLGYTNRTSTEVNTSLTLQPNEGDTPLMLGTPDPGAVPAKGETKTSSLRSFFTVFRSLGHLYYTENGSRKSDILRASKNAGAATEGFNIVTTGSGYASSVLLYRPTGGAEHIVVYGRGTSVSPEDLNELYELYRNRYVTGGFSSEWYQEFIEETWGTDIDPGNLSTSQGVASKELHGRRLVKIESFPGVETMDNRYLPTDPAATLITAQDKDRTKSIVNSLATIDMGGFWVTRKNAVRGDENNIDNGPADLTELMVGDWDINRNPVVDPRPEVEDSAWTTPTTGAPEPYVQVTPRQINPDQYLLPYTGFAQSVVLSTLNPALGTHTLTLLDENGGELGTRRAGQESPQQWAVGLSSPKAILTYEALPFHRLTRVALRLANVKTPSTWVTADDINNGDLAIGVTYDINDTPDATTYFFTADVDGWVYVDIPATVSGRKLAVTLTLTQGENRYNVEAQATFERVPDGAINVITKVAVCTGDGSNQPWWGSNFGFDVSYATAELPPNTTLTSVLVTYPSPDGLTLPGTWTTFDDAAWVGSALTTPTGTVSLDGVEYTTAMEALDTTFSQYGHTKYVEIRTDGKGTARDPSAMPILGEAYASIAKEPAIPFCVWGVYTVVIPTDNGTVRYRFLMRQAALDPTTRPDLFTPAAHTAPVNKDYGLPYFYLYSTPPRSAWLNELNLDADPYAEVVMPFLRQGILDANVPQTDSTGWSIDRIGTDDIRSTAVTLSSANTTDTPSWSTSYRYHTVKWTTPEQAETAAYVLIRPCGVAEGGVWTGVGTGGSAVTSVALTNNAWVLASDAYVVSGVRDATDGSVQLIGETESININGTPVGVISSDIAKRYIWAFFNVETPGEYNGNGTEGIDPDPFPWWNQVAITSTLRNTTYPGTFCGYQMVPGTFEDMTQLPILLEPQTATLSGTDWKYTSGSAIVLSYRPRANYHIQQITVPKELIGKIMLVGHSQVLPAVSTATQPISVASKVQELLTTSPNGAFSDWLAVAKDGVEPLAKAETRTVTQADGSTTEEYTGVITFNPDFIISSDGVESVTFADTDSYVVTIVFYAEPPAATNAIEVAMGQGEVKTGAWLTTQTLYALTADGNPDVAKGGEVVGDLNDLTTTPAKPIWTDEDGNDRGEHKDIHGWLYQPIVGDKVGMAAVINPELGLIGSGFAGGTLETLRDALRSATATTGQIRPVLLWTLIPKSKVPSNLMAESGGGQTYDDFMNAWDLTKWAGVSGVLPSVADGITTSFKTLRMNLNTVNLGGSTSLYARAGMIPMVCAQTKEVGEEELFAFRTMTEGELLAAQQTYPELGLTQEDDDMTPDEDESVTLLPFTSSIDMSDKTVWQDGAVLRFAIAMVDLSQDRVYEYQSITNFSSDVSDIYCPWYIPDDQSNINYRSLQKQKGFSPYMWVYGVPRDGVWLNELRPFGGAMDPSIGTRTSAALELAMFPSPVTADSATNHFIPDYSLDDWKVVMKVAPMPEKTAELETPINWKICREIPLHRWVPHKRIDATSSDAILDFYVMTTSITQNGFTFKSDDLNIYPYDPMFPTEHTTDFHWLKLTPEDGLEATEVFFADSDITTLPTGPGEILYAISLVRNNGVVEDEVLFYHNEDTTPDTYDDLEYGTLTGNRTQARLNRAVAIENTANRVAGPVRGVRNAVKPSTATTQFLVMEDGYEDPSTQERKDIYLWRSTTDSDLHNTLPGANELKQLAYKQPYNPVPQVLSTIATLSAQVVGGNGVLTLRRANLPPQVARSVSGVYARGSTYSLGLSDIKTDWYRLHGITKNGKVFEPDAQANTVYTLTSTGVSVTEELAIVQDERLTEDTQYVVTFGYTPEAALLVQNGDLVSEDGDFLAWLLETSPGAILSQTMTDGVTASEKYWLGFDDATISAEDVHLTFTQIGFHQEPTTVDGTTPAPQPTVTIALTKGGETISEIKGDGALVLLGKERLSDEWQFIARLHPGDINGERSLILTTPCNFFRAVLLSVKQATELEK